jgi:hypothetical protein
VIEVASIVHRVGIKAPLHQVHGSFATLPGLRGFWTETIEGDPAPGGELSFYFAGQSPSAVMRVVEINASSVSWKCVTGPPEWIDTKISFEIREFANECCVFFCHEGWREVTQFMGHCSTKWAYFLLGLKMHLEGADSVAYPHDMAISAWEEPIA